MPPEQVCQALLQNGYAGGQIRRKEDQARTHLGIDSPQSYPGVPCVL